MFFFALLTLLTVASSAPVPIYLPSFTLFEKFSYLTGEYANLHHAAIEIEDSYYEQRARKDVKLDRTVSTKIYDTIETYSLYNAVNADDIDVFLRDMIEDYKRMEYLFENMKYRLESLYPGEKMQTRHLTLMLWIFFVFVAVVFSQSAILDEQDMLSYRPEARQEPIERYTRAQRLNALNRLLKKPVFTFAHFFKKDM